MKRKCYILIILFFIVFVLFGCSSDVEKIEKNFNQYGYEFKLINEEFENHFDDVDTLVNIYGIYDESNNRVARIYEFETQRAVKDIIEMDEDNIPQELKWYKNMLMFPEVPDQARIVLIFFGHNPDEALNK